MLRRSALIGWTCVFLPMVTGCYPAGSGAASAQTGTSTTTQPAPTAWSQARDKEKHVKTEQALFGAGCFWGVEETFRNVPGVVATAVGYSGGNIENPTYKQVCTDTTGHVEVVYVEYDPAVVTYDRLLDVFWKSHDPTQVNRQGPDVGVQYRTVIFYYTPEQRAAAEAAKEALTKAGRFKKPIATVIEPARTFWRAEDYHQQYLAKRGMSQCHVPSAP